MAKLQKPPLLKVKKIFIIRDGEGVVWGVAPTKIDARIQIQWHLPKNSSYKIECELYSE